MSTISASFTSSGTGGAISIKHGDQVSYAVSGTFVGTATLERSQDHISWASVTTVSAAASATLLCETPNSAAAWYRFRVASGNYTSGTIVTAISDADTEFVVYGAFLVETVLALKERGIRVGDQQNGLDLYIDWRGLIPATTGVLDLGTASYKFQDAHFGGDVAVAGGFTLTGDISASELTASNVTASNIVSGATGNFTAGAITTLAGTTATFTTVSGTTARIGTIASPSTGTSTKIDDQIWLDGGDASGVSCLSFGADATEGLHFKVIDEDVVVSGAAAKYKALTTSLPSGCVLLSVQANNEAVVYASGTSSGIAIGLNGSDPDKYGFVASKAKNAKVSTIPDWAVLTSGEQLDVCAVMASGTTLGSGNFLSGGPVRVRLTYLELTDLANA